MFPLPPARAVALGTAWLDLMVASQAVIAMRLLPFTGMAPFDAPEMVRMSSEKLPALFEAGLRAQKAAWSGAKPDQITLAAMRPLTRAARGNRTRLTRGA